MNDPQDQADLNNLAHQSDLSNDEYIGDEDVNDSRQDNIEYDYDDDIQSIQLNSGNDEFDVK